MTISGTDISTFGLVVQKVFIFDMPRRKQILTEQEFNSADIVLEEVTYTFELFGKYASQSILATNIQSLQTLIKSATTHVIIDTNRGLNFTGVIKDGFNATVFRNDVSIKFDCGVV